MPISQSALDSIAFRRLVKNEKPKLGHPTSANFDLHPWREIGDRPDVSDRDFRLASAAIYLGIQLKSLRENRIAQATEGLSGIRLLQLAVAQSNREYLILMRRAKNAEENARPDHDGFYNLGEIMRVGGSRLQPRMNIDNVLSIIIDCFPHWLWHASRNFDAHVNDGAKIDWRRAGATAGGDLSVERGLRNLWHSVLWEDHCLTHREGRFCIEPRDRADATLWAAWEFRQQALQMQELLADAAEIRRRERPRIPPARVERSIVAIQKNGRTQRFKLGQPTLASRRRQDSKFEIVEKSYLGIFLDAPLDAGPETLTSRLLLQALCIISDLTALLLSDVKRAEIFDAADVEALSLRVADAALLVGIRDSLRISESLAQRIIERLSISLDDTSSAFQFGVWHRPLVRHPNGGCFFILAGAVRGGHPVRQTERWLITGGADVLAEGAHGLIYEATARRRLHEAVAQNPLLIDCDVIADELPRGDGGEQIDLIIRLGQTVIVGEIKCLLIPSESLERYEHVGKLEKAAKQAQRKASWLSKNRDRLPVAVLGSNSPDKLKFQPLVILNHGMGVGSCIEGVPVTDLHFLAIYLGNDSYADSAIIGPEGEFIRQEITLYRSQSEAESNFAEAMLNPPSIPKFVRGVRWRMDDFPSLEGMMGVSAYELDETLMRSPNALAVAAALLGNR